MKKWLAILVTTLFAGVGLVEARVVDAWHYDGLADGSFIDTAVSTGTIGNVTFPKGKGDDTIQGGAIRWVHDDVLNENGAYFAGTTPSDTTITGKDDGIFQYEVDFVMADFSLTAASANSNACGRLHFVIRDAALPNSDRDLGFRLWYDSRQGITNITEEAGGSVTNVVDYEEFRLEAVYKGTGSAPLTNFTGSTMLSNLHVRAVMDLNTKEIEYFMKHGSDAEVSLGTGVIDPAWTVEELRMHKQSRNGDSWWEAGDTVFTDNLIFSVLEEPTQPPPPEFGTLSIVDSKAETLSNTPENLIFKTFADAREGDVVVVLQASNKGYDPDSTDSTGVMTFGGTASLTESSFERIAIGGAPSVTWHSTVTADGSVDVNINHTNSFAAIGAYLLRSNTGVIEFLADAQNSATDLSVTNVYLFSQTSSGLFFEATAGNTATLPLNVDTILDVTGSRQIAHGEFSDVSLLKNIWAGVPGKRFGVAGLAFAAVVGDTAESLYTEWLIDYSLGADTNLLDDADGDELDNLGEYAFGGAPDNPADRGNMPVFMMSAEGGTNYLQHVHFERIDSEDRGLAYYLTAGTDLVNTNWAPAGIEFVGSGAGPVGFNAVTNRVQTDAEVKQFLRVQVEFTP